jgi:hypothetical protein
MTIVQTRSSTKWSLDMMNEENDNVDGNIDNNNNDVKLDVDEIGDDEIKNLEISEDTIEKLKEKFQFIRSCHLKQYKNNQQALTMHKNFLRELKDILDTDKVHYKMAKKSFDIFQMYLFSGDAITSQTDPVTINLIMARFLSKTLINTDAYFLKLM